MAASDSEPGDVRPTLGWSDLRGARVGVWGLGREGSASLRKLRALGVEPVLVDDNPTEPGIRATADGGLDALETCEIVVKTPGISPYGPEAVRLRQAGVILVGGLGLWLQEADRARVVCVTGTKGKSTTSSVIGHLLAGLGYKALVGGNFGAAPYDPQHAGDYDYWVIEVSSYTADRPGQHAAGHRGDLAPPRPPALARRRRAVLPRQAVGLLAAGGGADRGQRRQRPAPRAGRPAGAEGRVGVAGRRTGRDLDGPAGAAGRAQPPQRADRPPRARRARPRCRRQLPGRAVRRRRGAAARGRRLHPAAVPPDHGRHGRRGRVRRRLAVHQRAADAGRPRRLPRPPGRAHRRRPGPGHRLRPAGGGRARQNRPDARADPPRQRPQDQRRLRGVGGGCAAAAAAADAAAEATADEGFAGTVDCPDLDAAVAAAFAWARPDGVVLLSPAAPSFGRFRDYRDRGDQFAAAMRACAGHPTA